MIRALASVITAVELGRSLVPLAALEAELGYLDDDTAIVPEHLPLAVESISRRLEGEILGSELPRQADAIDDDIGADYFPSETAKSFSEPVWGYRKRKLEKR